MFETKESRGISHLLALSLIVSLLAVGACSAPDPTPSPTPPVDPATLVRRAADAMATVTAMHFRLAVPDGSDQTMAVAQGVGATAFEGDVVAPDRLRVDLKARFSGRPVDLQVIAIGEKQYLTNPLSQQWQDVSGSLIVPRLLDANVGISGALRQLEAPAYVAAESIGGVQTDHVSGRVPPAALAPLVGSQQAANDPVAVELWIGRADGLLYQATITGAILEGEDPRLVRHLELSRFNLPVTIEAPIQ